MPQPEGPSSTRGGRLNGSVGTAVAATDFVLGAGWGDSTIEVTDGSTVSRGEMVITCVTGGGLAQATATCIFTYPDGAFRAKPWFEVKCTNDNSLTAASDWTVTQAATTTTASTWTFQVLPVNDKTYTVRWQCIG